MQHHSTRFIGEYTKIMSLSYHYLCLAWTGEYEKLKKFLNEDLKLIGIWEQPGDKKVFKTCNTSISSRKSENLLYVEGTEVDKITQLLCSKIVKKTKQRKWK